MRRDSSDAVAEAARRRLELLSRELAVAGVLAGKPPAADADADTGPAELPAPAALPARVPAPGRHARSRTLPLLGRAGAWLQERLPATLQGRVALGSSHLAVIALVAALGLAVTAFVVLRSRPEGEVVPAPTPMGALVTPSADPSASPSASGTVVVDVAGKVRRPGVATLPAGSRVVDALRKAGGAKKGVDLTGLNLARVLADGEQVLVGVATPAGVAPSAAAAPGAGSSGPLVNLNSADQTQLEGLPGVGPVTAGKILQWREEHGAFTAVDDLLEVDGIGEKTLADIAPHVTL